MRCFIRINRDMGNLRQRFDVNTYKGCQSDSLTIQADVFFLGWLGGESPVSAVPPILPIWGHGADCPDRLSTVLLAVLASASPTFHTLVFSGVLAYAVVFAPHSPFGASLPASATPACKSRHRADSVAHVANEIRPALWTGLPVGVWGYLGGFSGA